MMRITITDSTITNNNTIRVVLSISAVLRNLKYPNICSFIWTR